MATQEMATHSGILDWKIPTNSGGGDTTEQRIAPGLLGICLVYRWTRGVPQCESLPPPVVSSQLGPLHPGLSLSPLKRHKSSLSVPGLPCAALIQ